MLHFMTFSFQEESGYCIRDAQHAKRVGLYSLHVNSVCSLKRVATSTSDGILLAETLVFFKRDKLEFSSGSREELEVLVVG